MTLFTKAKLWNQPKHPTASVCVGKMGHKHNGIFFSTVKENEVMLFRKMYVNGDKSKSSQPQTYTVCLISFVVPSLI